MLVSTRLVDVCFVCVFCFVVSFVPCGWVGPSFGWLRCRRPSAALRRLRPPRRSQLAFLVSPLLLSSSRPLVVRPVLVGRLTRRRGQAGRQADRQAAGGDHHEEQEQTNSNEAAGKRTSGRTTNQTTHKHTHRQTHKQTNRHTRMSSSYSSWCEVETCLHAVLHSTHSYTDLVAHAAQLQAGKKEEGKGHTRENEKVEAENNKQKVEEEWKEVERTLRLLRETCQEAARTKVTRTSPHIPFHMYDVTCAMYPASCHILYTICYHICRT